jgi:hypothetical protein
MQTPVLTTSAYVLHNLGLATGFGGSLFGKVALNPSAKFVSDKGERGKLVNAAWNGYNLLNALSFGATTLTWLIGRSRLTGRSISPEARKMVIVKDVLVGASLATGLVSLIGGGYLAKRSFQDDIPMESGNKATDDAPKDVKTAARLVNVMGVVNIICMAGIIGVSTWLDNMAGASFKWSGLLRRLP